MGSQDIQSPRARKRCQKLGSQEKHSWEEPQAPLIPSAVTGTFLCLPGNRKERRALCGLQESWPESRPSLTDSGLEGAWELLQQPSFCRRGN